MAEMQHTKTLTESYKNWKLMVYICGEGEMSCFMVGAALVGTSTQIPGRCLKVAAKCCPAYHLDVF